MQNQDKPIGTVKCFNFENKKLKALIVCKFLNQ